MALIVPLTLTREQGVVLVNLDQVESAVTLADGTTRIRFDGGANGSAVIVTETLAEVLSAYEKAKTRSK